MYSDILNDKNCVQNKREATVLEMDKVTTLLAKIVHLVPSKITQSCSPSLDRDLPKYMFLSCFVLMSPQIFGVILHFCTDLLMFRAHSLNLKKKFFFSSSLSLHCKSFHAGKWSQANLVLPRGRTKTVDLQMREQPSFFLFFFLIGAVERRVASGQCLHSLGPSGSQQVVLWSCTLECFTRHSQRTCSQRKDRKSPVASCTRAFQIQMLWQHCEIMEVMAIFNGGPSKAGKD